MRHPGIGILLVVWALVYSREGYDSNVVDEFGTQTTCMEVRAVSIDQEILREIGSALASQPLDNPMRQQAYARAARRVAARYRCRASSD